MAPSLLASPVGREQASAAAQGEPDVGRAGMGYRIFRDSAGTEWQAWDVVPRLAERRMNDRRIAAADHPVIERRRLAERRVRVGGRPMLGSGLGGGWLCFEARVEKRRLTPIPEDWQRCPSRKLEEYCRAAKPALRLRSEMRRDDESGAAGG